jgi:hypothetical protein
MEHQAALPVAGTYDRTVSAPLEHVRVGGERQPSLAFVLAVTLEAVVLEKRLDLRSVVDERRRRLRLRPGCIHPDAHDHRARPPDTERRQQQLFCHGRQYFTSGVRPGSDFPFLAWARAPPRVSTLPAAKPTTPPAVHEPINPLDDLF